MASLIRCLAKRSSVCLLAAWTIVLSTALLAYCHAKKSLRRARQQHQQHVPSDLESWPVAVFGPAIIPSSRSSIGEPASNVHAIIEWLLVGSLCATLVTVLAACWIDRLLRRAPVHTMDPPRVMSTCSAAAAAARARIDLLPLEHPYYAQIDAARHRHLFFGNSAATSALRDDDEARERARLRSHDPQRWRLAPSSFSSSAGEVPGSRHGARFDFELFDWRRAEAALDTLSGEAVGLTIQRPPLAYSESRARRGALEAGRCWYFSIRDFERALLEGEFELKQTDGDATVRIDLAGATPVDVSKPLLLKKESPMSVIEMGRACC